MKRTWDTAHEMIKADLFNDKIGSAQTNAQDTCKELKITDSHPDFKATWAEIFFSTLDALQD